MSFDLILIESIITTTTNTGSALDGEINPVFGYKRSGIDLLVQKVIKLFLTSQGSDVYDQEAFGVGFFLLSTTTNPDEVVTLVASSLNNIKNIILNDYRSNPGITRTDSEMLADLQLLNVNKTNDYISIDARIINRAGASYDFNIDVRNV